MLIGSAATEDDFAAGQSVVIAEFHTIGDIDRGIIRDLERAALTALTCVCSLQVTNRETSVNRQVAKSAKRHVVLSLDIGIFQHHIIVCTNCKTAAGGIFDLDRVGSIQKECCIIFQFGDLNSGVCDLELTAVIHNTFRRESGVAHIELTVVGECTANFSSGSVRQNKSRFLNCSIGAEFCDKFIIQSLFCRTSNRYIEVCRKFRTCSGNSQLCTIAVLCINLAIGVSINHMSTDTDTITACAFVIQHTMHSQIFIHTECRACLDIHSRTRFDRTGVILKHDVGPAFFAAFTIKIKRTILDYSIQHKRAIVRKLVSIEIKCRSGHIHITVALNTGHSDRGILIEDQFCVVRVGKCCRNICNIKGNLVIAGHNRRVIGISVSNAVIISIDLTDTQFGVARDLLTRDGGCAGNEQLRIAAVTGHRTKAQCTIVDLHRAIVGEFGVNLHLGTRHIHKTFFADIQVLFGFKDRVSGNQHLAFGFAGGIISDLHAVFVVDLDIGTVGDFQQGGSIFTIRSFACRTTTNSKAVLHIQIDFTIRCVAIAGDLHNILVDHEIDLNSRIIDNQRAILL